MKVAVLAPPWFAVPPSGYGGIEWIVWLLADGLADHGHEVTLFASGDSRTRAKLASVFEDAPSEQIGKSLPELRHWVHRSAAPRSGLSGVRNRSHAILAQAAGATPPRAGR